MSPKTYTLLALGDSYTIGEMVAVYESFPYQTVQLLRKSGYNFNAPEILAKTGWTTDDLQHGIKTIQLQTSYDFVCLLIGVNDQYQGKDLNEYALKFEHLLRQATAFAAKKDQVFVLSIPDWSVTPFARERDCAKIAHEIDTFNSVNEAISGKHNVQYINITPGTREAALNGSLLAADQLHPSGKEYAKWASEIAERIQRSLI